MKRFLIFNFSFLAFAVNAIGQPLCSDKKVITPVVPKPAGDSIVSATCTTLTVAWKGNANQTYIAALTFKNPSTGKTDNSTASGISCDNNLFCTATIPVIANTKVNWSVQAVQVIRGRTFYSYILRGIKDYLVPTCITPVAAARPEVLTVSGDLNSKVKIYPNPFQSSLNIQFTGVGSSAKIISLFDINGKLISIQRTAQNITQLNVKQISAGTYFIRVLDGIGKTVYSGKVVKE